MLNIDIDVIMNQFWEDAVWPGRDRKMLFVPQGVNFSSGLLPKIAVGDGHLGWARGYKFWTW